MGVVIGVGLMYTRCMYWPLFGFVAVSSCTFPGIGVRDSPAPVPSHPGDPALALTASGEGGCELGEGSVVRAVRRRSPAVHRLAGHARFALFVRRSVRVRAGHQRERARVVVPGDGAERGDPARVDRRGVGGRRRHRRAPADLPRSCGLHRARPRRDRPRRRGGDLLARPRHLGRQPGTAPARPVHPRGDVRAHRGSGQLRGDGDRCADVLVELRELGARLLHLEWIGLPLDAHGRARGQGSAPRDRRGRLRQQLAHLVHRRHRGALREQRGRQRVRGRAPRAVGAGGGGGQRVRAGRLLHPPAGRGRGLVPDDVLAQPPPNPARA